MDAQQFLVEFGSIANAPGGVTRLRELILQLAVSGRLTERETGDVPAVNLIAENLELQRSLAAERRMKRQHAPTPIDTKSAPWLIPDGWAWTRLGAITNYGDAPKVVFGGHSVDHRRKHNPRTGRPPESPPNRTDQRLPKRCYKRRG